MDFLTKLFDSFTKFFKNTTPVVSVENAQVVKAAELKVEVGNVEVKTAPAKKATKTTAKSEVAAKRVRKNGKFVGDDKAPAKKPTKKKPNIKIAK